jgi:MFS family permease
VTRLARLLVITFLESFATILIERGLYFYTHERLAFTDTQNLWLALGFGLAYAGGAIISHRLTGRLSEKGLLIACLVAAMAAHVTLCLVASPLVVVVLDILIGGLSGLKWPVVESYVSCGLTPRQQAPVVGKFNVAWSTAVPAALVAAGPLIAWASAGLFVTAAALNLVSLALVLPLERRPVHLPADHPERPNPRQLARIGHLLGASRWSMISTYSLMWILAALVPGVLSGLAVDVRWGPALSGVLDVVRAGTFLVLQYWHGWHDRGGPLVVSLVGVPLGFFATLFAPSVGVLLAGELVFGLAAGMTYYAALYYAMVHKNASVDAGGAHEGLIGAGFAIGPVAGLAGHALGPRLGSPVAGMMAGTGVVIVACAAGAARSLVRLGRVPREDAGGGA